MAGTLTASVIKNDTTSPPAFQDSAGTEIGRLCRAWVTWNGNGGATISNSFNVSSVTRNGTGDYTVNFTNAMPHADYAVASSGLYALDSSTPSTHATMSRAAAPTTSAVRIMTGTGGGVFLDFLRVTTAVFC